MSTDDMMPLPAPLKEYLAAEIGESSSDAARGVAAGIHAAIRAEDLGASPGDPRAASARLLSRLATESSVRAATSDNAITPRVQRHASYRRIAGWGGAAIAALGLLVVTTLPSWQQVNDSAEARGQITEHRTGQGQRATILLPDSSRMVLGPLTTVRYTSSFGKSDRTITVDGEAFFDVRHHRSETFTVQSPTLTARVLGTQFSIRSYVDDSRVIVATGKVAVSQGEHVVTVAGGHEASLRDGRLATSAQAHATELLAWTDGQLVYRDTRLEDVMRDMQRWFGVRGTFANSAIADLRLSGSVQTTAGAQMALQFITSALGVKYRETGETGQVEFYR